jgi:hypothetical protein
MGQVLLTGWGRGEMPGETLYNKKGAPGTPRDALPI